MHTTHAFSRQRAKALSLERITRRLLSSFECSTSSSNTNTVFKHLSHSSTKSPLCSRPFSTSSSSSSGFKNNNTFTAAAYAAHATHAFRTNARHVLKATLGERGYREMEKLVKQIQNPLHIYRQKKREMKAIRQHNEHFFHILKTIGVTVALWRVLAEMKDFSERGAEKRFSVS